MVKQPIDQMNSGGENASIDHDGTKTIHFNRKRQSASPLPFLASGMGVDIGLSTAGTSGGGG